MTTHPTTTPRVRVLTIGRDHYVQDIATLQFVGLAFSTKRWAQATADTLNAR